MMSGKKKLQIVAAFASLLLFALGLGCNGFFVDPVLTSIAVGPTATINQGATVQESAIGTYNDGSTKTLGSGVQWSSSAATTATVNSSDWSPARLRVRLQSRLHFRRRAALRVSLLAWARDRPQDLSSAAYATSAGNTNHREWWNRIFTCVVPPWLETAPRSTFPPQRNMDHVTLHLRNFQITTGRPGDVHGTARPRYQLSATTSLRQRYQHHDGHTATPVNLTCQPITRHNV